MKRLVAAACLLTVISLGVGAPAQDSEQFVCTVFHVDSDGDGTEDLWVCGSGGCSDWGECQGRIHSIDTDGDGTPDLDVTIDLCRCH